MADDVTMYEQQEERLRSQSEGFIRFLTNRGIIGDEAIKGNAARDADRKQKQNAYHNTMLLLKNYRTIAWLIECFPDTVAEELDRPFASTDEIIDHMDIQECMGDRKLESRVAALAKSRLLLDRINEAITVLKKKPANGERLYELIYLTYVGPEKLKHQDILYRMNISSRQYYRLRDQAVTILSIRLWAAPAAELGRWLEMMDFLEGLN